MKHFFDDDGMLQFEHNDDLLLRFAALAVANKWNLGDILYPAYCVMSTFGAFKAVKTEKELLEWKNKKIDSEIESILKDMLFDAVERGFIYKEFILIAFSALNYTHLASYFGGDESTEYTPAMQEEVATRVGRII